jgi:hypothetical protein
MGGYLATYLIKGNSYQVWKFASFAALPLSFVFSASLLSWLWPRLRPRIKPLALALSAGALILAAFMPLGSRSLVGFYDKMHGIKSYREFFYIMNMILGNNSHKVILIDLKNHSEVFCAIEFFKAQNTRNIKIIKPFWALNEWPLNDYSSIINGNSDYIIISSEDYKGIINNPTNKKRENEIYVYEKSLIKERGFVSYFNFVPASALGRPKVLFPIKISLPEELIGKRVKLSVSLALDGADSGRCAYQAFIAFPGRGQPHWAQSTPELVEGVAAPEVSPGGTLRAAIKLALADPEAKGQGCSLSLGQIVAAEAP